MAAFPGSSLLHERLSEYAASPADSVSSPWSFAPAGPVVAAGGLSSPFFPGPSEDLARGSPRGRAAAGLLGCLGSPLAMRDPPGPCCWPQSHAPGKSHVPGPAQLSGMQGFWVEKSCVPSTGAARGRRDACGPCRQKASPVEWWHHRTGPFEERQCSQSAGVTWIH